MLERFARAAVRRRGSGDRARKEEALWIAQPVNLLDRPDLDVERRICGLDDVASQLCFFICGDTVQSADLDCDCFYRVLPDTEFLEINDVQKRAGREVKRQQLAAGVAKKMLSSPEDAGNRRSIMTTGALDRKSVV